MLADTPVLSAVDSSRFYIAPMCSTKTSGSLLALVAARLFAKASRRFVGDLGTEDEISHALADQKERRGLPELHVWINHTVPSFQPEPPEIHDEKIAQWRL